MATDRFIVFSCDFPPLSRVREIVQDYFGSGFELTENDCRFLCRILGASHSHSVPERWIEIVVVQGSSIDVITRNQDEFTCAIADGLSSVLARRLSGQMLDDK